MMKKMLSLVLICLLAIPAFAGAEVFEASSAGFGGEVKVTLTVENGKIVEATAVGAGETPGFGADALEPLAAQLVAAGNAEIDAQCHGQQVLFGIHDVHQAAQALRGMLTEAYMDVDAAAAVHPCAGLLDAPDNRLHHFDVLPAAHWADHLCSWIGHGGVAFNDPLAAVWHGDVPIAQVVIDVSGLCAEIGGDGFGCAFSA